ncbi:hypothetical protein E4U43_008249 [Claviceps pusilla]|uniref:Uncharacterized protein n=1 Tax=Claviceps pusilla TaxID=123648 RepID=A0A9P7NB72_9HYPO|nr:hypothetical protein E4U43_008249 [Claviceps pusilla]
MQAIEARRREDEGVKAGEGGERSAYMAITGGMGEVGEVGEVDDGGGCRLDASNPSNQCFDERSSGVAPHKNRKNRECHEYHKYHKYHKDQKGSRLVGAAVVQDFMTNL